MYHKVSLHYLHECERGREREGERKGEEEREREGEREGGRERGRGGERERRRERGGGGERGRERGRKRERGNVLLFHSLYSLLFHLHFFSLSSSFSRFQQTSIATFLPPPIVLPIPTNLSLTFPHTHTSPHPSTSLFYLPPKEIHPPPLHLTLQLSPTVSPKLSCIS